MPLGGLAKAVPWLYTRIIAPIAVWRLNSYNCNYLVKYQLSPCHHSKELHELRVIYAPSIGRKLFPVLAYFLGSAQAWNLVGRAEHPRPISRG